MFERKNYNSKPEIIIDEKSNNITISGNSIPEDSKECWFPFIHELENILTEWPKLTINFKFDIYNTASTSHITKIMDMLFKADKSKKIVINWYYLEIDEDMMESGEDYKELYLFKNFNLLRR